MRLLPQVFPCQSFVCSSQLTNLSHTSRLPNLPTLHTMCCINHNVCCHVTSLVHYTSPFPDKSIFCSTSKWCSKERTMFYRRKKVLNNRTAGLYCSEGGNERKFLVASLKITTVLLNLKCSQWLPLPQILYSWLTCYNKNHHNHLPPWSRSPDLFWHWQVAIVSWGVHNLFFLKVCSWGRVFRSLALSILSRWLTQFCIWISCLVFQGSLVLFLWLCFLFCPVLCILWHFLEIASLQLLGKACLVSCLPKFCYHKAVLVWLRLCKISFECLDGFSLDVF